MPKFVFTFVLYFSIISVLPAQDFDPRISEIRERFSGFKYEEVVIQCEELLNGAAGLSQNDSLELYRLSAISQFSLFNMAEAVEAFSKLLAKNPEYRLDVLETPPKIISYFNSLKRLKEQAPSKTKIITVTDTLYIQSPSRNEALAYSLLFPGIGHLYNESPTRGWILASAGAISLATAVFFSIETADREDKYLRETNTDRIENLYIKYNQSYQRRNIAYTIYGAIWIYAQIDLLFFKDIGLTDTMTLQFSPWKEPGFSLTFSF